MYFLDSEFMKECRVYQLIRAIVSRNIGFSVI